MAKELPYFRFTPSEWQNGSVSLEDYELQGFFIQVCSYYWINDCSITRTLLEKKYRHDKSLIESCINLKIFTHNSKTDYIEIKFLNDQFDLLSKLRKDRQTAGSKGGYSKASNATAKLQQKGSYKDKDKYKDKENYKDKYNDNNGEENENLSATSTDDLEPIFLGVDFLLKDYIKQKMFDKEPIILDEKFAKSPTGYLPLIKNIPGFIRLFNKTKTVNETDEDFEKRKTQKIIEFLKEQTNNKVEQKWENLSDLGQHVINYIKKPKNGNSNRKSESQGFVRISQEPYNPEDYKL